MQKELSHDLYTLL